LLEDTKLGVKDLSFSMFTETGTAAFAPTEMFRDFDRNNYDENYDFLRDQYGMAVVFYVLISGSFWPFGQEQKNLLNISQDHDGEWVEKYLASDKQYVSLANHENANQKFSKKQLKNLDAVFKIAFADEPENRYATFQKFYDAFHLALTETSTEISYRKRFMNFFR
jgi:hypothetical protein